MLESQGAKANAHGKIFEKTMKPTFTGMGYQCFMESDVKKDPSIIEPLNKYILENVEYKTIYGHTGRTEYVIVNNDRRIRVEAKWQSAAGSVDEKFCYTLINAIESYPEDEVILVIDGGGYKPGARKWVADAIENNFDDWKSKKKSIQLMTITEFMSWFMKEML